MNSDAIIATGDGGALNILASANEDARVGGGFLGISALNDAGTAVFLGFRQGTFAQAIADPVAVIETGDPLFGSTVVSLSNSRFSLNDRAEIVFRYGLADGRSGIAVAFRNHRTHRVTATSTPAFRP